MCTQSPVGASLLAMDVNDNAPCLNDRVVWAFFASRLAPTVERIHPKNQVGYQAASRAFDLAFDLDLPRRKAERTAMDGRSRRAHGAGPERGYAEPRRGTVRQGRERLVTWGRAAFRFSK
ncbi:hypothetical protein CES87_20870 [Pseudomonas sp. ERMR1:02]|nr:hypothetical protein CES87_20870 [Pseudomonas sp. ERMR1:02]